MDKFQAIVNTFKELVGEIDAVITGYSQKEKSIQEEIRGLKQEMEEELSKLAEVKEELNSYLTLAMNGASALSPASAAVEYDKKVIERIALRVLMGHTSLAAELYTLADGMLKGIQYKEKEIRDAYTGKCDSLESEKASLFNHNDAEAIVEKKILPFIKSDDFQNMKRFMENKTKGFGEDHAVSLGSCLVPLKIPDCVLGFLDRDALGNVYDIRKKSLRIPYMVDLNKGGVTLIEYALKQEDAVLGCIQSSILMVLCDTGNYVKEIRFFDPIRYNTVGLGILSDLVKGGKTPLNHVADSKETLNRQIGDLLSELIAEEEQGNCGRNRRLIIFHAFPENYDSETAMLIRRLCVNAKHYGLSIVLTMQKSGEGSPGNLVEFIKQFSVYINCAEETTIQNINNEGVTAFELDPAPAVLPSDRILGSDGSSDEIDLTNDYGTRIGYTIQPCTKGNRKLQDIPYGIDIKTGEILTLNFEKSYFATFICGASRSGKSTLLHTIITSIIRQTHPDDIEIWLIDFKMTEFSRYIAHTPPHVRYIILDKSKELVFDIIDRLTEIMFKRQSIFKCKWDELSEVPPEKYMPSIFVVIDEFSIMSETLANSVLSESDNYVTKMQMLLSQGAALGLHFIFSSQGFTNGTRGLNEYSKLQIQQRIAMKTSFSEIRDTLDLRTVSDADRRIMENLPVHHTLLRIPEDEGGNHLIKSHVLYISDDTKQEALIEKIKSSVIAKPKYDAGDQEAYIDKKTLIVDGNSYNSFQAYQSRIRQDILSKGVKSGERLFLYPGIPQRMMPLYSIDIVNGYCENILCVGSLKDKDALISIVLSLGCSGQLQSSKTSIWCSENSSGYDRFLSDSPLLFNENGIGLKNLCQMVSSLKEDIRDKKSPVEGHRLILLIGLDQAIQNLKYVEPDEVPDSSQDHYGPRGEGELDLLQQMAGGAVPLPYEIRDKRRSETDIPKGIYDVREDIKYILTHGPRLGYHFIVAAHSYMELSQMKLSMDFFRHKLIMRMPRGEAMEIVGSARSVQIMELENHVFFYTNGMDAVSFRPFLHSGISFDGWILTDAGVENRISEEDQYLL